MDNGPKKGMAYCAAQDYVQVVKFPRVFSNHNNLATRQIPSELGPRRAFIGCTGVSAAGTESKRGNWIPRFFWGLRVSPVCLIHSGIF